MTRCAVLLRGVNVGGHNRIAMPDFRALLEGLGFDRVVTYLQSGNAVAGWDGQPANLAERVADHLAGELGLAVPVLVRTGKELGAVLEANPFAVRQINPKLLHVAFLSAQPDPALLATIDTARFAPDEMRVGDRALYLWYAGGVNGSKLAGAFLEKRLGVVATARNWATITALHDLARDGVDPG